MSKKRETRQFPCRIDELVPLARLLRTNYVRDQADFQSLLPADYTPDFLTDFDARLTAASELEATSTQIARRMMFTGRIATIYQELPKVLDFLEARLRRATPLTVPAKRFGIEAARHARNTQDDPALEQALKTLLQNIGANQAALAARGQQPADTQQLQDLYDALVQGTTGQGTQLSTQMGITQENIQVLNALYQPMALLFKDGKSLYNRSDKVKRQDYTLQQLLKRVRQERTEQGGGNQA